MHRMEEIMEELTLEKFEEASEVVQKVTQETKLVYSEYFSAQTGNRVYFKPENMQVTGAYKVRGAYYKISTLSTEEKERGLIAASAGNHAQGVAYAAMILTKPVPMPMSWRQKRAIPLYIPLTIRMWRQGREALPWRLLRSCLLWTIFWFRWAEGDFAPVWLPWQSF